ncbi:helix-turn-helix domain-containing protein [Flaviaesturariibacter amylovorans]|uniref:TetR/AcrR family transcriptional regulator n=1 Tax=Flaviaesturariibacter amylovorans TaxID=1084520 RepID=A0ABP8GKC2_9BACT
MEALILDKARELFFAYGLKSVSMDDIARLSGISKKTLYQHFADKQELVDRVVAGLLATHTEKAGDCAAKARNAVAEVALQVRVPFRLLAGISPGFFYELERYFPATWMQLLEYRRTCMTPRIVANLRRGQREGLYRDEVPEALAVEIRLQQLRTALNPAGFTERRTEPTGLIRALTEFYLQAIGTAKGRKLINEHFNPNNDTQAS